jgi:hypothetical protein
MNQNLFFSSVCEVKTVILEKREILVYRATFSFQEQKTYRSTSEIDTNREKVQKEKGNNKELRAAFTVQRHLLFLPHQPQKTTYHATMK